MLLLVYSSIGIEIWIVDICLVGLGGVIVGEAFVCGVTDASEAFVCRFFWFDLMVHVLAMMVVQLTLTE